VKLGGHKYINLNILQRNSQLLVVMRCYGSSRFFSLFLPMLKALQYCTVE